MMTMMLVLLMSVAVDNFFQYFRENYDFSTDISVIKWKYPHEFNGIYCIITYVCKINVHILYNLMSTDKYVIFLANPPPSAFRGKKSSPVSESLAGEQ